MSDGMPGDHEGIENETSGSKPLYKEGTTQLVICEYAREDCKGCDHAIAHKPITNFKKKICTDMDRCSFRKTEMQCKAVA